ncbi:MAG: zinc-dependent alcohol dehydrogenase family protein [Actinobacteria bacterium]|jgi:propanol-preferring alcohol dehydrogenase|nr:zinc-dependent alcohol dehydrogenase family protein [Actinomycetota bacterium]
MRAWIVKTPGPIHTNPLQLVEKETPNPGPGQLLVKVLACGVCRTDLHLAEGDLNPKYPGIIPGHEVIGTVIALAPDVTDFRISDRVGIAWLQGTCGSCRFCRSGSENLCNSPVFTGWDNDGGFAEYAVVNQNYAYKIPEGIPTEKAAPLLCSGIIGYRALLRAQLNKDAVLGIYGFGASAHLAMQVALHQGARVHVITRSEKARQQALRLGASSAIDLTESLSEPLSSAIIFAPSGELVPLALKALDRGGTLAIAGIYLSDIPRLNYEKYLFLEKTITSVTANTRSDGKQFLDLAVQMGIDVATVPYPFEQANQALSDLAKHRYEGAAVLMME